MATGLASMGTIFATAAGSSVKVCVNKSSKAVFYKTKCASTETMLTIAGEGDAGISGASAFDIWLKAGNTGTEQDFLASLKGATGPAGPAGATGQQGPPGMASSAGTPWDIGLNCSQKMAAAESAGYVWVLKNQRSSFEQKTGCLVEQTTSKTDNDAFRQSGLVYVESWKLLSISDAVSGDGWTVGNNGVANYQATYSITIGNLGSGITPCSISNGVRIYKGPNPYEYLVETYLREQPNRFSGEINFGLTDGTSDCGKYDVYDYPALILVNEDPAALIGKPAWAEQLRKWGW